MTGATRPRTTLPTVLLVAVTAVWGSTFVLIHDLVRTLPATDFLAVRFTVASLAMAVVFRRALRGLTARDWRLGLGLGVVYGIAQLLQTIGLEHTPASRSGFLTALYVVLTPVIGAVVLHHRPGHMTWAAVLLAVAGSAVLSLGSVGLGIGETLTIAGAAVYALHIVLLGHVTSADRATGLATVQIFAVTAVTAIAALPGGIRTPPSAGGWAGLLYMALVAGAAAMWAQTWAQSHLPAARAAVVMTTEPVFAAGFAVAVGGESLTWRMLVGGAMVVAAMYVAERG